MQVLNQKGKVIEVNEKELVHKLHDQLARDVAKLLESEEIDLSSGTALEASCFLHTVPTLNQLIKDIPAILERYTKDNFFELRIAALKQVEEEKERFAALATAFGISEKEIQMQDQQCEREAQLADFDL